MIFELSRQRHLGHEASTAGTAHKPAVIEADNALAGGAHVLLRALFSMAAGPNSDYTTGLLL